MQSFPAPVGGWNARDALAQMKATDAVTLENWFPGTSDCEIRGGYGSARTGMADNGRTLAVYNGITGASKMFCFTLTKTYDVSSAGAVGGSVATRTAGRHVWVNFGDGTNNYLIAVNGADKPLYYNGSSWTAVDGASSPALTGLTTTTISYVNAFKGRLFFLENSSLSFWYLAAGAAGGALTEFPLDGEATMGGYLMAMATWTVDAGDGEDDRAVFITSEGQVIVYQGTNPASAASWAKVGTYYLGKPLGRKCFFNYGGDLGLLTQDGVFPLSTALQSATIDKRVALSDKIDKAFNESARSYFSTAGWRATVYPARSALVVNIPVQEDGTHEQYVMNTITRAWCKFTNWNAEDFVVFGGELYFTTGTAVYKAWTGAADNTANVVAFGKSAFTDFGRPGIQKFVKGFQPVLSVNGNLTFLTDIDVDFKDGELAGVATYSTESAGIWDAGKWDIASWGATFEVVKKWTSPSEYPGFYCAGKVKIATNALTVRWMASTYIFEYGSPVG